MATFSKFNSFVEALAEKKHDLGADVLKVLFTNTAPIATNTVKADLTDITPGNGYSSGGVTLSSVTSAQTSGAYKLDAADFTFTPSGGSVGPFRYLVLYNDTAASKELIGWWDLGSAITLASAEAFPVTFDAAGILTLT